MEEADFRVMTARGGKGMEGQKEAGWWDKDTVRVAHSTATAQQVATVHDSLPRLCKDYETRVGNLQT